MRKTTKIIAAGISTIALAGGIGVGIASADPSTSPTPSASPTSGASPSTTAKPKAEGKKADEKKAGEKKAGEKKHRDLTTRALHGEVTLGGKKARVVVFQRGTVDKVSASSITVKSKDGFTATYSVAETTKIRQAKTTIKATDIKTADRVRVLGPKDGETVTATRIIVAAK